MLPEVTALHRTGSSVRIPPADSVPISARVRRILDSPPMRRLASIRQLGLVALVYPGATHSRLEHSLGVYHHALRLLARFSNDPPFTQLVAPPLAEAFVLASLVHDLGHWPFCHPIEDMRLSQLDEHESRVGRWFDQSGLSELLESDWQCELEDILALLGLKAHRPRLSDAHQLLASCLSGPIDIDKLDYLQRDSLHCGVPYGRHFDAGRLIDSMCVHPESPRLAVGEKGRTAAEMMVFSRYVMFSEVYWHHAVRAATAMLQRAVFELQDRFDLQSSLDWVDSDWIAALQDAAAPTSCRPLVEGLFGAERRLYKRAAEFNVTDCPEIHALLARRPYRWLIACSQHLSGQLSERLGIDIEPTEILIDAPPVEFEVDINIDVLGRDAAVRSLGDVSPIASALANQQFDNYVKRVRVYVPGELRAKLRQDLAVQDWSDELRRSAARVGPGLSDIRADP